MANLDIIRTLTLRAKAEGFGQAEAAVGSLGQAYETSARRQMSVEKSLAALERRFIAGAKQAQDFERVQRQLNSITAQFPQMQERANTVLNAARANLATATVATTQFGNATKGSRYELINLSRQLQDVGVGLASSQSLFTVAIQQGTQIADVFATAAASGRNLGKELLNIVTSFFTPGRIIVVAFTAAVGALVGAFFLLRKESESVEESLKKTSDVLDLVSKSYQSAAKAGDEYLKTSKAILEVQLQERLAVLQQQLANVTAAFEKAFTRPTSVPSEIPLPFGIQAIENAKVANTEFAKLNDIINNFNASARKAQDVIAFREAVAGIANAARETNPQLAQAARTLLETTGPAGELAAAILRIQAALEGLPGALNSAETAFKGFVDRTRDSIDLLKLEAQFVGQSQAAIAALKVQHEADRLTRQGNVAVNQQVVDGLKAEISAATAAKEAAEAKHRADQAAGREAERRAEKIRKLREELAREGETAFLSTEDARIAERLKDIYPDVTTAINSAEAAQIRFNNRIKEAKDLTGDFLNDFISGMLQGKSVTDSLSKAMEGLGQSITRAATKNLAESIVGQAAGGVGGAAGTGITGLIGSFAPSIGAMAGPLGALAGVGIGIGISMIGKLFADDNKAIEENNRLMQQHTEFMKKSTENLNSMIASLEQLGQVSAGPVTSSIQDARRRFEEIAKAANEMIRESFFNSANWMQVAAAIATAEDAIRRARAAFEEASRRMIENARQALREMGKESLSPVASEMKQMQDAARDLEAALIESGVAADEAARIVAEDLAVALKNLAQQIERDLIAKINELKGKGWINQLTRLKKDMEDALAAGVDQATVDEFVKLSILDIAKSAKLSKDGMVEFIRTAGNLFPTAIAGMATELLDLALAATRTKEEIEKAALALEDRLFNALNDTSTLAGALAAFDREANKQREDEMKAGGENMVLLETVLAAERANIIRDFNKRAVEAEGRAAEERLKAINAAAANIVEYVNSLFTGPESPLSPAQRLQAAQDAYNAVLAVAQTGDIEAQQQITQFAEDLRKAALDFYGSSTGYQTIVQQIKTQLLALPAPQEATDPVVTALADVVSAINLTTTAVDETTTAVGGTTTAVGGTTSAVNTNTGATNSQTTTQSNENAAQLAQQQLLVSLANAANTLATTANTLTTSTNTLIDFTNNLITSTNSLVTTSNSILTTMNSVLDQIKALNQLTADQITHLGFIRNATEASKLQLDYIAAKTDHMYAPPGSALFFLAGGGFVDADGMKSGVRMFKLAAGGFGTDTVPAMLTPGEFVVRQPVASRHAAELSHFNRTGAWPANDNVESLLKAIYEAVQTNTAATVGQTRSITREARFAARRQRAS